MNSALLASSSETSTTAHLSDLAGEKCPDWLFVMVSMIKICAEEADDTTHPIL
jgi:hypothetical protein